MIDRPGLYEITAEAYHADPCTTPSLSSSIARELIATSPWHAWHSHPRLNPAFKREDRTMFDLGTAAHAYLLEGDAGFEVVDSPDWKRKDARVKRDLARLAGKVPILKFQWESIKAMVAAAQEQLDIHDGQGMPRPLGAGGKPEQSLIWREGRIWCRARLDWLHTEPVVDDYKTTQASAHPTAWARTMLFRMGYDFQEAFYRRGYRAIFGADPTFRFVVQENFKPYALTVIALHPAAAALADEKVEYAIRRWDECTMTGRWPGYPRQTCFAELPPWEEAQWREREFHERPDEPPIDDGRPLSVQLFGEQEDGDEG